MGGGEASKNDFPSSAKHWYLKFDSQHQTAKKEHPSHRTNQMCSLFYLNISKNKSKLILRRNVKRPKNLHWKNYLFWSVPRGFNKQSGFMKHAYSIRSLRKYLQVPCFQLQKQIFFWFFDYVFSLILVTFQSCSVFKSLLVCFLFCCLFGIFLWTRDTRHGKFLFIQSKIF